QGTTTGITNPNEHLMMYRLTMPQTLTRYVTVANQFGNAQNFTLGQPQYLGVPSWKNGDGGPNHINDHFKFYDILNTTPLNQPVKLTDQFVQNQPNLVMLPRYFGVPVDKIHGTNNILRQHPTDCLVCYTVNSSAFTAIIQSFNQFVNGQVNIT